MRDDKSIDVWGSDNGSSEMRNHELNNLNSSRVIKPGFRIVRERHLMGTMRENEPVIRDEADEWMMHLNDPDEDNEMYDR